MIGDAGEQLNMFDSPISMGIYAGCYQCICRNCLMWWSSRCPYGECYDDHRAEVNPYDKAHPNEPPRTAWSNWKTDQAFWCRGGIFYPAVWCEHYVKYQGSRVEDCLGANVQRFQDGYIRCGMGDPPDCHSCYKRFEERMEE